MGKSANLAGNFHIPALVSMSGTSDYISMVKRRKGNFTGHFQNKLLLSFCINIKFLYPANMKFYIIIVYISTFAI